MDKESRVNKLQKIISKKTTISGKRVKYKDNIHEMPAYQIPLEYLIFNI